MLAQDVIGIVAACLTTGAWAPQAIKILKSRETRAISLVGQSVFASGTALWFVYGLFIGSWPVIIANGLTLLLVLAIIGKIGTAGGTGHVIEYAGSAVRALSMEARFSLCNMTIEAGARTADVAAGGATLSTRAMGDAVLEKLGA